MQPGHVSAFWRPNLSRLSCLALSSVLSCIFASSAAAQIDRPGAHPHYSFELEPHFLVQWDVEPWDDDGLGLGFRASIPVVHNGPIRTINNSFAVGIGLDWASCDQDCWWTPGERYRYACDTHNFTLPVVAQWNFFFTDAISVFVELGLGIVIETWDYPVEPPGDEDESDVEVDPVFLLGPRFILGDRIAIPIRIGLPYLSVGVSFLV